MATDQWLGTELAGYRIDELIGRGGAGVVYRATHLRLQRPAAVKLLAPTLAADAAYRRRFEREARLAAALEHPHIVPIYDAGYTDDVLYLAMAFIDGPNLAAAIDNDGRMDLPRVYGLLTGVAEALDSAHQAGLVHRDVKPANVLLTIPGQSAGRERAYLCDFGIARHTSSSSTLTSTGQFLGTLHYCAPEQIQGQQLDGRTDQYALACMVYHCLTGLVPYPATEPSAVMFAHISADPPRVSAQVLGLPAAVDGVIARALAKQPADRFPDCTTFLQALAAPDTATSPVAPPRPAPTAPGRPPTSGTVIWPPGPGRGDPRSAMPAPTGNHERGEAFEFSVLGRVLRVPRRAAFALLAVLVLVLVLFASVLVAPRSGVDGAAPSAASVPAVPSVQLSTPTTITVGGRPFEPVVSPRGDQLFAAVEGAGLAVVDTRSRTVVQTISLPDGNLGDLHVSPDGRRVYALRDTGIDVVDVAAGQVTGRIQLPRDDAHLTSAISRDGRLIVVPESGRGDGPVTLVIVDTATQTVRQEVPLAGMTGPYGVVGVDRVRISPDGNRAYACYSDPGPLIQIDLITRTESSLPIPCRSGSDLAFSADVGELYVDSAVDQLNVLNADTGSLIRQIPMPGRTSRFFPTPSGKLIFTGHSQEAGSGKGAVSVADSKTGEVLASAEVDESSWSILAANDADLSPDGRQLYWCNHAGMHVIDVTEA